MTPGLGVRLGQGWAVLGFALDIIADFHHLPVWGMLTLWALPLLLLLTSMRHRLLGRLTPLAPWFVGVLLLLAVHTFGRLIYTGWYNAPYIVGTTLLLALVADAMFTSWRFGWVAVGAAALLIALWLADAHCAWQRKAADPVDPGILEPYSLKGRRGETDCGIRSYFAVTGITNLDGVVNPRAHEAIREGRLLEYAQRAELRSISATDYFHFDVFFGPGYREEVLPVPGNPAAVRVVTDERKNRAITLHRAEVAMGTVEGRSYLGKGWSWNSFDEASVLSVGRESHIIFYVASEAQVPERIELRLAAEQIGESLVQPVKVELNGATVAALEVKPDPEWHAIAAEQVAAGRNRVVLRYGAPAHRDEHVYSNILGVRPLRALRLEGMRAR